MSDHCLSKLSARDFEHMVQALAGKVIGPGVRVYGDGPDGAREVTFEGLMQFYPTRAKPWNGYLVMQAKHCQRPTNDPRKDGAWALRQLSDELEKFADSARGLRRPDYYIFATNVVLTPVHKKGTQDKAFALLAERAKKLKLKAFDIWDFDKICRLLDMHPDVRASYDNLLAPADLISQFRSFLSAVPLQLQSIQTAITSGLSPAHPSNATPADDADAKAEIDRAGKYLEQGKLDVAAEFLDDVERQFGDRLSARARFRVFANRGHIARLRADIAAAAGLYLQAREFQPEEKDARFLEAFARVLLGDESTARRVAEGLRSDFPEFAKATLILIATSSHETSFSDLKASIPPEHLESGEVCAALARKAAADGNFAASEEYARRAVNGEPNWVEPKLILAEAILERALEEPELPSSPETSDRRRARLQECVGLFDAALEKSVFIEPAHMPRTRLNRAVAYDALGDADRAKADVIAVHKDYPNDPDAVLRRASLLAGEARQDEAIEMLDAVANAPHGCPPDLILLRAQLLGDRNRSDDRARALQSMQEHGAWVSLSGALRAEWLRTHVHLLLDNGEMKVARRMLKELSHDVVSGPIRLVLQARVEQAAGDQDKASRMADDAAEAIGAESTSQELRRLAVLLQDIGKPEKALPLWKKIVAPGQISTDVRQMLRCADRSGEEDLIIDTCAVLRRGGKLDRECLDLEIAALGRRSPQAAADMIRETLSASTDDALDRFLRLRLSHIGLYTKRPELLELDPNRLPTLDEVNPQMGRAVVTVLVHGPVEAAVSYAYELYRRYPDNFDAHMAVVESVGFGDGANSPKIDAPKTVTPGCAVCISMAGDRKREWWIIEDGPKPNLARNERAPSDPLVQRMLGKSKGQKFMLRDEPAPLEAKVVKIENKFIFRWQDCFFGMETRFSQQSPIWSINVGRGKGKYDFTLFLKELDRHAKKGEERDEWFKDHPVPVAMFAEISGKSILEAMQYIGSTPALRIRCCLGAQEEMESAQAAVSSCSRLVLDGSALSTLFMTGTTAWLAKVPVECVVTEHTFYEFRRMELLNRPKDKELVQMGKVGEHYTHNIWTPEQLRPLQERLEGFIRDIETHCVMIQGTSLASLLPAHREALVKACGRGVAESIVIAAEPSTVFWTDDHVVSELAKYSMKVSRTWTQSTFMWFASEGLISRADLDRLSVDLLSLKYHWTQITPEALITAGEEANWDVHDTRFNALLSHFSAPEAKLSGLHRLAGGLLKTVWQRGLLANKVDEITFRVLRMLDARPGGRRVVETIYQHRLRIFGGDLYNAERLGASIRTWLDVTRTKTIVIPDFGL